jgi:hypothetical protein
MVKYEFISRTSSFTIPNLYLWCSAPNDELNSANQNADTVLMNVLISNLTSVGMSELKESGILVYPNPSSGIVKIHCENNTECNYSCMLQTISGEEVCKFQLQANEDYLLDRELSSGIYFLTYISNSGNTRKLKLLKY